MLSFRWNIGDAAIVTHAGVLAWFINGPCRY